MNCYLDSSAPVKRYLVETGSSEVVRLMAEAKRKATVAAARVGLERYPPDPSEVS